MKTLSIALKIILMGISLSFFSCAGLKPFPPWNPKLISPSRDKAYPGHFDQNNLTIKYERDSHGVPIFYPINSANAGLEGALCTPVPEQKPIVDWIKDTKVYVEKHCGK